VSKTILAVDDSTSVRELVSKTLSAAGYRIIEAVDGIDGYAKATASRIDAIVTDFNMPGMNGIEFIRKYRTHPSSKGVPIIFLSTESAEGLQRQAREAGATGWIVKPFRQDHLLAVMRKVAGG
jgi:two-component system, chemotaxis family, chemotaxis protein CheY